MPIDQLVFVAMKRILAGEFYHKLCYDWITESLPLRSTVLNNYMFLFNSYIGFMREALLSSFIDEKAEL